MKQRDASHAPIAIPSVPFRAAPFGSIGQYMEVNRIKLHALQPTVLMRVDLPQRAAMGTAVTGPGYALSGVKTGRPVTLVAVCLGKLFAVAAFNPLDPQTRRNMMDVAASGKFTCALQFDLPVGKEPSERIDHALISVPLDVFGHTLLTTEGMAEVGMNDWLETASGLIAAGIASMKISGDLLKKVHFRPFLAFSDSVVSGFDGASVH